MTKQFKFISDKEYDTLAKKYNLVIDGNVNIEKNSEIDKLIKYYELKLSYNNVDEDSRKVKKIIDKTTQAEDIDYFKNTIYENGYKMIMIDKGVNFYKGLTWFYD